MKRAGKYFTKGLQAGVLATALVTGMTGCPNPSSSNGGYEMPSDPTVPTTPSIDKCDFVIPEPGEFDGVKLVKDNEEVWGSLERDDEFDLHYQQAQAFMNQKVAELSQAVAGQTGIALYQEIDEALQKMNQGNNIRDNINNNYNALATVFADLEKNQLKNYSDENYYTYQASYIKLAHHAYNQSLGTKKDSTGKSFPGNSEMRDEPDSFFGQELALASLSYDLLTVDAAKTHINNTMNYIADNNGVDNSVLKRFVELALYNESLYGLNDLAKFAKVDAILSETPRRAAIFKARIGEAKQAMQARNIEDAGTAIFSF